MLATCTVVLCGLLALEVVLLLIRDIIKLRAVEAESMPVAIATDVFLPRVALLFLTRGPMPFEPLWRAFLHAGAGGQGRWADLFAIYVHPPPDFAYPPGSLFHGREVPGRVAVEWGQHSVMEAERRLVSAAALDPRNARFVLLSETCGPLYPAPAVYTQLVSEGASRVNACSQAGDEERRMAYRWQPGMLSANVTRQEWRKSSQWFMLTRKHAEAVAADEAVAAAFEAECFVGEPPGGGGKRFCVSDEHYLPTLLAHLGLEGECACQGVITHAHWDGNYFHPRTYGKADASLEVLARLRGGEQCDAGALVRAAAAAAAQLGDGRRPAAEPVLPPQCPLFARKLDAGAGKEWNQLLAPILE